MALQALIDPADFPPDQQVVDLAGVESVLAHRYEFQQVHALLGFDEENDIGVGFRKAKEEEFWVRGHIPGRPIFPGVLMIEAMAQTAVVHARARWEIDEKHKWIGFGGVEKVRFRGVVGPGEDLWLPGKMVRIDTRRGYLKWQGQVVRGDGQVVCDATVVGVSF